MLPGAFVFLPEMPSTASGKTDYKSLLSRPMATRQTKVVRSGAEEELSPIHAAVASLWKQVLHLDGGLTPSDDFFALGGHSLLLMHVRKGIEESCGVDLNLAEIFGAPTIAGMAALVPEQNGVLL
jgi:Phosphopantetheine attachment site